MKLISVDLVHMTCGEESVRAVQALGVHGSMLRDASFAFFR